MLTAGQSIEAELIYSHPSRFFKFTYRRLENQFNRRDPFPSLIKPGGLHATLYLHHLISAALEVSRIIQSGGLYVHNCRHPWIGQGSDSCSAFTWSASYRLFFFQQGRNWPLRPPGSSRGEQLWDIRVYRIPGAVSVRSDFYQNYAQPRFCVCYRLLAGNCYPTTGVWYLLCVANVLESPKPVSHVGRERTIWFGVDTGWRVDHFTYGRSSGNNPWKLQWQHFTRTVRCCRGWSHPSLVSPVQRMVRP